jgi:uncharacterized membrane protein YdjX (TVP38/TMEM64 family)
MRRTAEILLGLGIASAFIAAVWLGLDPVFEALGWLETRADEDTGRALAIFFAVFVALSLTTLPVVTVACLASGYLFGPLIGGGIALAASTSGATLTYAMVRIVGGQQLHTKLHQSRFHNWLTLLEKNVHWYLVVLRIVPVAPFFLINAGAGLTTIGPVRFVLLTMVGLLPLTILYVSLGNGLESLEESRDLIGPGSFLEPVVALPIGGLIALLLIARLLESHVGKNHRQP